jgi:hypothetical protein
LGGEPAADEKDFLTKYKIIEKYEEVMKKIWK